MKTFLAALAAVVVQASETEAEGYGYGRGLHRYSTSTSGTYDPWTVSSTPTSTSGWYSPYQQYSPPKIPYTGGNSKVTEFATCQIYASPQN